MDSAAGPQHPVDQYWEQLVQCISNLPPVLDHLLQRRLLTKEQYDNVKDPNATPQNKMRALYPYIMNWTNLNKDILYSALRKHNPGVLEALEKQDPPQVFKLPPPIHPDSDKVIPCSKEEYDMIRDEEWDEIYPIRNRKKRKRHALIICNIDFFKLSKREGAQRDIDVLNYVTICKLVWMLYVNLLLVTLQQMQETMEEFSKLGHKDSDSTFLVLMSHGNRDIIYGTDGEKVKKRVEDVPDLANKIKDQPTGGQMGNVLPITIRKEKGQPIAIHWKNAVHVDMIFNTFNNVNCGDLTDKPKVVLVQACRGEEHSLVQADDGASFPSTAQRDGNEKLIQKERDFICFYSTTPGTYSYRDPENGTYFIQSVIKHIKQDAHHKSIDEIFRDVQASFKDKSQMPTLERTTATKKFYLFPGY
ncbi:caspase-1-A-like [Gastrophryne carolinensis]